MRSEVRAFARVHAIWAKEEATTLDVIAGTFSLFNTITRALVVPK